MTLQELLKDKYKEGMTLEEVTKELEGIEAPKPEPGNNPGEPQNPMQTYETDKLKAAVTKANAEAARLKRELQARMSEEERREAERKAKEDEVNEKLAELHEPRLCPIPRHSILLSDMSRAWLTGRQKRRLTTTTVRCSSSRNSTKTLS